MIRLWGGSAMGRRVFAAGFAIVVLPTIASAQSDCGASWEDADAGLAGSSNDVPIGLALAEFDTDGSGPNPYELFLGGHFAAAGSTQMGPIARWDGFQWSRVASASSFPLAPTGLQPVYALWAHDPDGPEGAIQPVMAAGGSFTAIDGVQSPLIATWSGQSWSALPGLQQIVAWAMTTHDFDADGPAAAELVVGGSLWGPGGVSWGVWRWSGTDWLPLGSNRPVGCHLLASFDHDDLPSTPSQLIAQTSAGYFILEAGQWADLGWSSAYICCPKQALETRRFPGRVGEHLLVVPIENRLGIWDGNSLQLTDEVESSVKCIAEFDPDGSGPLEALVVAGIETVAGQGGGVRVWTGTEWLALTPLTGTVYSMIAFDEDQSGPRPPALFAAGDLWLDEARTIRTAIAKWSCPHVIQRCLADLDASSVVDFNDVALILGGWGERDGATADANRDGVVGFNDVSMVLGLWGSECAARPYDASAARGASAEPSAFEQYTAALAEFDGTAESRARLDTAFQALRRR